MVDCVDLSRRYQWRRKKLMLGINRRDEVRRRALRGIGLRGDNLLPDVVGKRAHIANAMHCGRKCQSASCRLAVTQHRLAKTNDVELRGRHVHNGDGYAIASAPLLPLRLRSAETW